MNYYSYRNDSQIYFSFASDAPRQSLFCHQALPKYKCGWQRMFFKLKRKCWEVTLLIYQNCFLALLRVFWRLPGSLFQCNRKLFGTKSILSFKVCVNCRPDAINCWISTTAGTQHFAGSSPRQIPSDQALLAWYFSDLQSYLKMLVNVNGSISYLLCLCFTSL